MEKKIKINLNLFYRSSSLFARFAFSFHSCNHLFCLFSFWEFFSFTLRLLYFFSLFYSIIFDLFCAVTRMCANKKKTFIHLKTKERKNTRSDWMKNRKYHWNRATETQAQHIHKNCRWQSEWMAWKMWSK